MWGISQLHGNHSSLAPCWERGQVHDNHVATEGRGEGGGRRGGGRGGEGGLGAVIWLV